MIESFGLSEQEIASRLKREPYALVLGGGGLVGIAYIAGTIAGFKRYLGVDLSRAELVVGTSAGAVVGAYLRKGYEMSSLAEGAIKSPDYIPEPTNRRRFSPASLFATLGALALELSSSGKAVPKSLATRAGEGMFTFDASLKVLKRDLGSEWPERRTWLVSYDLKRAERVVLGRDFSDMSFEKAVAASCAIPGFYPAVRAGGKLLVDGGVYSVTNLDLVLGQGLSTVVVIAPLSCRSDNAALFHRLMRRLPTRQMVGEIERALDEGLKVVSVTPSPHEMKVHGLNVMSRAPMPEVYALAKSEMAKVPS